MAAPNLPAASNGSALTDTAILWKRQMRRFANNPLRIFGMLLRPLLWLLIFGVAMGTIIKSVDGKPYVVFAVPGIVAMSVLASASRGGDSLLRDKNTGFLREVLVAPVSRSSVLFGFALGITTRALINAMLMLLAGLFLDSTMLGDTPLSIASNLLLLLTLLTTLSLALVSITIGVAWLMDDPVTYGAVSSSLFMPLFMLSGGLFKVKGLPLVLYALVAANPLAYGVDSIKQVLLGPDYGSFPFWLDLTFVFTFCAASVAFALYVLTRKTAAE